MEKAYEKQRNRTGVSQKPLFEYKRFPEEKIFNEDIKKKTSEDVEFEQNDPLYEKKEDYMRTF